MSPSPPRTPSCISTTSIRYRLRKTMRRLKTWATRIAIEDRQNLAIGRENRRAGPKPQAAPLLCRAAASGAPEPAKSSHEDKMSDKLERSNACALWIVLEIPWRPVVPLHREVPPYIQYACIAGTTELVDLHLGGRIEPLQGCPCQMPG